MKDFVFLICFLFFLNKSFGVYIKDEQPSTKPPLQVEELPWLSFFDRKSSSNDFEGRRGQAQRRTLDLVTHSTLCPPGETGQLPYPPDCKRFINCWKGRGSVQVCAPGTLFNSETLECDFPGKVKCEDNFGRFGDNHPMPTGERYVRFPDQRPQILHNPRIARKNPNEETKPDSIPAKPYPGRPPYFGASHLQPPSTSRPGNQTGREVRPQCPLGATGLYPHPYDCSKFLKCWSGNTFIQNCGPGTFFNPLISACDHPRNVPCTHDENYQPVQPDDAEIPAEDLYAPEESIQHEQYQHANLGVKATKDGKNTVKHDTDSPNYDEDPKIVPTPLKSEAEDLELSAIYQTNNRKPKVINKGKQNPKTHRKEPVPYLTPPMYDVYGNVISSNNSGQANLGVQPGHVNSPKVQTQNPSAYPSDPYLISYPPQGPYSTVRPGDQKKLDDAEPTKNYYGHMLNKKHLIHPQHPQHLQHSQHPHHTGPPAWLVPPPYQPQFFPHYAPHHPSFFPKSDSSLPHIMHIPSYPTYISEGNLCSANSQTDSSKPYPSAPKCEPGLSFYGPNVNQGVLSPSQWAPPGANLGQKFPEYQNQNKQNFNPQVSVAKPSDLPPAENNFGPGFTPQLQTNLTPDIPKQQQPTIPQANSLPSSPQKPDRQSSYNQHLPNYFPRPYENPYPGFIPQTNNHNNAQQTNTPQRPNSQPTHNQQQPSYYPKPQENPYPGFIPQSGSLQTSQYQPYLFYYYPGTSGLYHYYPSYYPNRPQTSNYPHSSKTDMDQGQILVSDPFGADKHRPSAPVYGSANQGSSQPTLEGPVEVPDSYDNKNYDTTTVQPNYNKPHQQQGQQEIPDPFDNKNYVVHLSSTTDRNIYSPHESVNYNQGQTNFNRPHQQQGQQEIPDAYNNKNYVIIPSSTTDKNTNTNSHHVPVNHNRDHTEPIYNRPNQQQEQHESQDKNHDTTTIHPHPVYIRPHQQHGQEEEPDPFENQNYDNNNKDEGYSGNENIHGTPYYPSYNPTRPGYGSNTKPTEPKETATFPPFPGYSNNPHSANIKTGTKTRITPEPPREYLLEKIDVRTGAEDDDSLEDAENIPTTQSPTRKRGSERVDEAVIKKPSYIQPNKYSEPKETNRVEENPATTSTQPELETEKPKQQRKPYVKVKQTPPNGQIVRLRNGASHLDGYLEMKDSKSKWGLVCDAAGSWGITEATVACRELGFIRGAELSWKGYPIKSDTEDLKVAVNGINCTGKETSLAECKIMHDEKRQCDVGRNAVGLRCFDNLASHCQPGEILYNQHCYKLHGKKNPDDPWIKTDEASEECKKYGGKLVDITSQYENDFLSEWLIKKHTDVTAVATGGIGISVLGRPMWLWEGTNDPMVYERWWSGWSGDQNIPKGSIDGPLCIVLRKTFSCTDNDDDAKKNAEATNDEETCSADYFFWDVEDCGQLRTSVFICERPMDDIGCVVGNGEGYVGTANTTASGLPCLPWDHPKVVEGLARRGRAQERSSRLVGHNYCRNLGNPDRHPWCFVEGNRNSEYCAIPQCWDSGTYSRSGGSWSSCDPNQFECAPGECIKKEWVCDGQKDCTNGRDEDACKVFLQEFTTERNKKMRGRGNEKWPNVNQNICAKLCLENKNFKCKSFSYNFKDKECLLSDSNVGLSGQIVIARGWAYHERTSESLKCSLENGFFGCHNGMCINISNVCDGKKNCEDGSDERDCERLGYRIRLAGSQEKHRGRVEVKVLGKWGVICDDMFDMRDAAVVCREVGFKLGAAEVFKHSEFPVENPLFLVDHLDCFGNETSIRECRFPGWGKHNCGPEEVVGVSCRVPGIACPEGHWQCKRSKECISLAYLCDELKDCDDGTDEDKLMCGSPTQIRLAGGPNATSGRLEIRRYDIWGTVCHDDFSSEAGHSVCRLLGFNGPSVVKKSAYFGPGKGPIWLDSGLCFVNETNLEECTKHTGFQNNCKHDEDVSLICSVEDFKEKSAAIKPIAASSDDDDSKRSEEKLRQVLISECSGKPKTRAKILRDKIEKVVGGSDVAREALPWQASVRVRSGSGKSVHWCGAIVISPYHVLTAGHCLRDYNKAAYFIRVGDYDTKVQDPHERELGIEHLYMHPNFSKGINLNNDIGLVKVKGEIPLEGHIKPACLAPSVEMYLPGTNCSVSGWGSVSANAAGYARTLRRAFLPILEASVCRAPFVYGDSLSEGMFCAGHLDGGVDSCQGDSGGPLMCQHEGREYLFGITSWGHGCGRANKPGVYTNVAFYTEWIQQKIHSSLS